MATACAVAHPNIALVKYWGKQQRAGNVPATPSLSITLDAMATHTCVQAADHDEFLVNGKPADAKATAFVAEVQRAWQLPPLAISSCNDFPTGAGLASSASGFAALVTALDAAFGTGLDAEARSAWARRGSASAARSIFGGFVTLAPSERARARAGEWVGSRLLDNSAWPLEVVVAITSEAAKVVSSTAGMTVSRDTSPFYGAWLDAVPDLFEAASAAVVDQDFEALADVSEHSCRMLHALMLSSRPGLIYWNEATLAAVARIDQLKADGVPVFYTIDAGSQVKAVCAPGRGKEVAAELAKVDGVLRTLRSGLGEGARIVETEAGG